MRGEEGEWGMGGVRRVKGWRERSKGGEAYRDEEKGEERWEG